MDGRYVQVNNFFEKMFGSDNFELHFYQCVLHSDFKWFFSRRRKIVWQEAFLSKKYKSVKQQFSFWFFLIFSRAPFFRISNKVDSDSPGYLLSCHGCFFYRRNNFIKFQLRPLCMIIKITRFYPLASLYHFGIVPRVWDSFYCLTK